jgi:DNA-binding winged helix-turn-helix (wHTH) protein
MRYRFAELEFDAQSGRLTRAGEELQAQPKVIELLRYFLDHPGVLVSREAVLAAVWGAQVSESALGQTLRKLRATLGDDEDAPRFVETVPRRGFRFLPDVRALRAESDLRLATLREAIRRHPVVTLLGTRGSGRRTLAARVDARRVEVGPGETLLEAVARVFGVPAEPGTVRTALAAEPLPVVVVRAEAEEIRSALGDWLSPERLVVVLGEVLGSVGECVVHVPPLTTEEAVALYLDEARRCGATPSPEAAVAALVAHLDHHPGAIRIAAARALVLPAETLLARLERRFELLPDLAALAGEGWGALPPADQRALLSVALFEGPFSLAEAEQVAGPGDGWIGESLERLAARGLVLPRPPGLFVRETLRRWLALTHGDALAAARSRLAGHLLPRLAPLLARLERRPDPDGLSELRRWLPELRAIGTPAARDLVAGLHEILGELGAGLDALGFADTPELLLRRATLLARARRVPEARAALEAACAAGAEEPACLRVEAIVLGARAETGEGGLSEEALSLHKRAAGAGPRVLAATATTVAVVHRRAGRAAAAQEVLKATAAQLPSDAELARAVLLANIGVGHLHAGDPGAAVELLELAARDYAGFGLTVQETLVRLNLAAALLDDGRADDAERVLAEVEVALVRAGHVGVAEVARGNRGTAALLAGRLDDAERHFRAVLDAPGASSRREAFACWGLATAARFANKSAASAAWIDRGLALVDVPPRHRGLLLAARAGLEAEAGSLARGREAWTALAELAASGDEALLPALVQVLDALLARAEGETRRPPPGPRYAELLLELGRLRRAQRMITA